jgi:hypothetical protein
MKIGDRVKTIDGKEGVIIKEDAPDSAIWSLLITGINYLIPYLEWQLTPIEEPKKETAKCLARIPCSFWPNTEPCRVYGGRPCGNLWYPHSYAERLQWAWEHGSRWLIHPTAVFSEQSEENKLVGRCIKGTEPIHCWGECRCMPCPYFPPKEDKDWNKAKIKFGDGPVWFDCSIRFERVR